MTETDEYGLDPDKDWEGVATCRDPDHKWGPWVLSPVFANREDRFCTACGVMEMQYMSDGGSMSTDGEGRHGNTE